ncbi:MAG: ABC transporter permease [Halobacteriota archaeon]|nr:ABC transporter permease [Halobacteriota archaeon]
MFDTVRLTYRNIMERKTRTLLTLLGIAVGIAAIVSLMSVGYGMEYAVTEELTALSDIIIVTPGQFATEGFSDKDVSDIERIKGVSEIGSMTVGITEVKYRGESIPVPLAGFDPHDMKNLLGDRLNLIEGRFLEDRDQRGCVVGFNVAEKYFKEDINLNDKITIGGTNFRVVGIYEQQGAGVFSDLDKQIHTNIRSANTILKSDEINIVMLRVDDIDRAEEIAKDIEDTIDDNHRLEDFTQTTTMFGVIRSIKGVFDIIRSVLISIGAISLIVASMGIMNTMLVSVMERTHEIGIMKAIGATNANILSLFLIEAGIISLAGGLLGIVFGVVGAEVISSWTSTSFFVDVPAVITVDVLVFGLVLAILVGIGSGLYPARQASKMSPVEAVRYE